MEKAGSMGRVRGRCVAAMVGLVLGSGIALIFTNYRPPTSAKVVLKSSLAGSWYPAGRRALARELDRCLAGAEGEPVDAVHALIQPHAAYRYSGEVAAHGLQALQGRAFRRVVVLGPSHKLSMPNVAALPDATHYRTPLGDVPLDTMAMSALLQHDFIRQIPEAHATEHSVQIQVPLLQHLLGEFTLVPLVIGQLDDAAIVQLASVVREVVDSNTLVIASTDFTHFGERFGFTPFEDDVAERIRALDMGAWEQIEQKDAAGFRAYCHSTGATICGRNAVAVLLAMLPPEDRVSLLKYDTSGRLRGDFSHSVSYLSAAVCGDWPQGRNVPVGDGIVSPADGDRLLRLARDAVALRVVGRDADPGMEPTAGMQTFAGSYVSVRCNGELRGCIGNVHPYGPLFESVMNNAVRAATGDDRFPMVTEDEFSTMQVSISVLRPPRRISSAKDIELGRHGIVLSKKKKRAVYLPGVPIANGWTLDETMAKLSLKAGLPEDAWKSGARLEVFETEVIE